jgi:hypothetical protein
MAIAEGLVKSIDEEIARLTEVRTILSPVVKRGRPAGVRVKAKAKAKSRLTPDGRKRLAAAMRKRWKAAKKASK